MNRRHARRLLGYLRPYLWPTFTGAMLCMVAFSGLTGVLPFLVREIFDEVFSDKDAKALAFLPFAIVGVFLLRGLLSFGSSFLTEYVGQRIIEDLRNQLNAHIQSLSLSFFNRNPTGTILSRVSSDVLMVRNALTESVASVLKDSVSLVTLVAVAFWMDPMLAAIAFVAFPASVLPILRLSKRLRRYSRKGQETLGELTALLQETVQGNRVVKAFGMEEYEERRFAEENRRLLRLTMKSARIRAFTTPMMEIFAAFAIAGVVWYGGHSVIEGGRTQGAFMAFLTALFMLYDPFKSLGKANNAIQQGFAAADRVFELLDTVSDVVDRPGARAIAGVERGITFEGVSFRYERDDVLSGVTLEIGRGQVVALVGPSGGGKSTLADLILRFYDVSGGAIRIDGTDVRDITLTSLRAQIGLVTQHTFLFNDTVRNNIAYGGIERDLDAVVAAARAANAHEFIQELPQQYDTVIGELGLRLSGGQRQRLSIARAILKNAPVLVLDEATSALDNESERLVQQALDTLMEGRTTLVIAHRLSTVRRADRIVVLVGGRIVEQGTHDELLALGGEYKKLHDLQFVDEPAEAAVAAL